MSPAGVLTLMCPPTLAAAAAAAVIVVMTTGTAEDTAMPSVVVTPPAAAAAAAAAGASWNWGMVAPPEAETTVGLVRNRLGALVAPPGTSGQHEKKYTGIGLHGDLIASPFNSHFLDITYRYT